MVVHRPVAGSTAISTTGGLRPAIQPTTPLEKIAFTTIRPGPGCSPPSAAPGSPAAGSRDDCVQASRPAPAMSTPRARRTAAAILSRVRSMVRSTPCVRAATLAESTPLANPPPAVAPRAAFAVATTREVGSAAGRAGPCVEGDPVGDAVEPAGDGGVLADGTGPAGEGDEGRLKGVLSFVFVAEHAPAHAQDGFAVPPDQQLEGGLVAPTQK